MTGQVRWLGSAVLSNSYNTPGNPTVDNNGVPAVFYGDLRGSYRWGEKIQFYAAVDNLFNAPPPNIATASGGGDGVPDLRLYRPIISRRHQV